MKFCRWIPTFHTNLLQVFPEHWYALIHGITYQGTVILKSPWALQILHSSQSLYFHGTFLVIKIYQYFGRTYCFSLHGNTCISRDKWVPVTMVWRVLRLQMKEQPPIWRVAANILNKQSRKANKGWSSSFGVGQGVNNSILSRILLRNVHVEGLGPGLILLLRIGTGGGH